MTNKYECDRCHEQFREERSLMRVTLHRDIATMNYPSDQEYHYCPKCTVYALNALQLVNDGSYNGSLNPNDKIGCKLGQYFNEGKE